MALPYATENQLKLLEQKTKYELDKKTENVNLTANTLEEMNALVTKGSVTDGQLCYCKEDKKLYVLKDNVWGEVGGGGGGGIPTVDATFSEDGKFTYNNAINSDIFIANLKDFDMKALLTHYSVNVEDTKIELNIGLLNEMGLPCLICTTADDSGNMFDTLVPILTAPLNFGNGLVYHDENGIQSLSNGRNNQILSMQSGTPTWVDAKKEVKPILNLMGLNGAKRTTITAEERTNFYAGLYSGIYYYDKDLGITEDSLYFPEIIKGSSGISIYKVTRKYITDTTFSFIPVGIIECDIKISYTANSDGTYNFTIKKAREIPIDYGSSTDASVQQVNAYGEGGATTIEKGKISTDLTGVDLKVPFVLNIYENSTLSGKPTRIVMTNKVGEIYLGNFDFIYHYLVQMIKGTDGKYSYASSIVPNATENTLFNKPILVPENLVDPTPILPCTTADNGKVLSVVNGEAQWASASSEKTLTISITDILTDNSKIQELFSKMTSTTEQSALISFDNQINYNTYKDYDTIKLDLSPLSSMGVSGYYILRNQSHVNGYTPVYSLTTIGFSTSGNNLDKLVIKHLIIAGNDEVNTPLNKVLLKIL